MNIEPIGTLKSCFPQKFGTPRQPLRSPYALSVLKIDRQFQPEISLEGLASFSHAWLIFDFHQIRLEKFKAKIHAPRLGGDSIGVYATRSPHRPNRLGLSLVEIIRVDPSRGQITFGGADLVDGTPIFDIKPYLPEIESIPHARGGWTRSGESLGKKLQFAPGIEEEIAQWFSRIKSDPIWAWPWGLEEFKCLVRQVLEQDPRPTAYRDGGARFRETAIVPLFDRDLHIRFEEHSSLVVLEKMTRYQKSLTHQG